MFRSLFQMARKHPLVKLSLGLVRRAGPSLREIDEAVRKLARGETDIGLAAVDREDEIGRLSSAVLSLRDVMLSSREVEEQLRASLAEKSAMLDQAPVGILAEREGAIVACNPCLERIFGYPPGELVGHPCRSLHASDGAFARIDLETRQARQRGQPFSGEVELRRKDGKVFWGVLSTAAAGPAAGCNIWVYRDISDAKRADAHGLERRLRLERLVAERTRQLEEARQRAASIAVPLDAPQDGMARGNRRLAEGNIEMMPFDPASMIEGVAAMVAPLAEEKGLELVLESDPRLPPWLLGASLHIAQALTNLLSNAIRYARQGEIVLAVREAGHDGEKLRLEFRIRSQGVGVTRERKGGPSDENEQAGAAPTSRRSGARRLGLVISKRLVESIGSTLTIENDRGRGHAIHFTADFEIAGQAGDKAESYAERLKAWTGRSVMVVDDNRSACLAAAALLSRLGFAPAIFESGWTALASLVRPGSPDYLFVCIDRRMPEIDGLEVARRLRAHFGGACPPLLLMTAFSHAAELQGAEHGCAAVLSKPLTIDRLFGHVAAVLGVSEAASAAKPAPGLKGKRVLLVQGEGVHQEIMADFLRGAGLAVRIAGNALDALQAVREHAPDCVLLDCCVPDVDVRDLAGKLRFLGYTRLPIVGLSSGTSVLDAKSCLAAGMSDFVATPLDLPALLGVLARWTTPVQGGAAADGEALPPLPPELDVESGLRHLRGKTALFLKALRMFRDSCGRQFQLEFHSAVRAGDWQTAERLAHSLKGTAATIGANQVSAAAARLEAAIRAANYAEANALLAGLTEKLQILVEGLAHIG